MLQRKDAIHTFLLVLMYGLLFHLIQFALFQRDMVQLMPDGQYFDEWDAGWYKNIADNGYQYTEGVASNSAFYPLFPFIWKLSHLGVWGISILNMVFFAAGVTVITRIYRMSMADKMVWLTLPSIYFCFIPYTESLFFLLSSVVLYAMHKQNRYLIWVSLLLVSLVRPVSMIFIPAFLIMEVIAAERKDILKATARFFVLYGMPLLLGTVFFIWYQYYSTGIWFAFFRQEKNWGHVFALPTLPFDNMYGPKLLWVDALAMFVGFICMLLLLKKGIQWLFRNKVQQDKLLMVSYLYLTAILFVTILFNPIWGRWRTNVYDIHRYALVNPFFFVFLYKFTQTRVYKAWDYVLVILLSNAFWLLLGSYAHLQFILYFQFNTVLLVCYMLYANKKLTWPPVVIAIINFYIQIQMFQFFMLGVYPG